MLARRTRIFVSHSPEDRAAVKVLQKILGIQEDKRGEPQKDSTSEITPYLGEADLVVVFWSRHAAAAEPVRQDYLGAIGMDTRIIPVRLDDRALPGELAAFETISCADFNRAKPAWRFRMALGYIALALAGVIALVLGFRGLFSLLWVTGYIFDMPVPLKLLTLAIWAVGITVITMAVRWARRVWERRKMEASLASVPMSDTPFAKVKRELRGEFRRLATGLNPRAA